MKFLANRKLFKNSNPKKPTRILFFAVVIVLFCGFLLLFAEAGFIYHQTNLTLEKERQKQSKQNDLPFTKVVLTPHLNKNVAIIQNSKNVRSIANFQNSVFAATAGGLVEMSENGEVLRRFSVLDGLPESDLTALAVFGSKLFIGTKSKGLLSFDGEVFEAFYFPNHETKSITTLFSDPQRLLIGTFSGGLLQFDGNKFIEIKAFGERIENLTFLHQSGSFLIAGTFANGVLIRKDQIWKRYTTADGLFSNRIISVEIIENNLFVASDLGISQAFINETFRANQTFFLKIAAVPNLSGLAVHNELFYLTRDNGETFELPTAHFKTSLKKTGWKPPEDLQSARLLKTGDEFWFLSEKGIWKNQNPAAETISLARFGQIYDENQITDNNVSALTIDQNGRLWVGTFRNGIDIFSASGKKLKHFESEMVREVNFLIQNPENKQMLAATSGGAVSFDELLNESLFAENAELPSRSVSQISLLIANKDNFEAISTAKGLIYKDKNSRRIFSTINGLPGNSVFTALFFQNSLFVGTMNGLAQIENGKLVRVFKTSNSDLKNNWISALCPANDRLFIGTYGGGIFELLPSGDVHGFNTETGQFSVNPNAMYFDGERLFAGTLGGVWCLNLTTQKWSNIKEFLPADTILSITGNGEFIYFGTTNGIARINKNFWIEN